MPAADRDPSPFTWTFTSDERAIKFCSEVLGFTSKDIEAKLLPVLKRWTSGGYRQVMNSSVYQVKDDL